ncbi:hypothetical protein [Streptomyces sp. NPDC093568]|uniref:hypothetical protein n=1 Tax=Streptomyces sp. NPDC093568 TaxID=3366041 RepID=UPI00381170A0
MGVTADRAAARETVTDEEAADESAYAPATPFFSPRGRHRRRRPRKVLLAAGGLALAAGALSLVRLTPDSHVTGLGNPDADPAPAPGTDTGTDSATNAAATVAATTSKPNPSATSAMGGLGATPTTRTIVVPTPKASTAPPPAHGPTTPDAPSLPASPSPTPPAETSRPPRPAPTPGETETTSPPVPEPDQPDENAVCVPVIGLCVDHLTDGD